MLRSLSSGQRATLTAGTLLAPVFGLVYMAAGLDGSFIRAGKRGAAVGLAGACGLASVWAMNSQGSRERLDSVLGGSVVGGAVGLAAGVVGSFGYDALRAASD